MAKFWGDNYFSPAEKKFVTEPGVEGLPRCFNQFIMKPIITLVRNCMEGQMEEVTRITDALGIQLKATEKEKKGKDLMKCVF